MSSRLPILLALLLGATLAGAQPTDPKPKKVKLPPEQRFLMSVRDARETDRALEGKLFRMPTPQNPDDPPAVAYPAQTEAAMANLAALGAALKAELDNPDARAADIQSRLAAFRRARTEVDRMLT